MVDIDECIAAHQPVWNLAEALLSLIHMRFGRSGVIQMDEAVTPPASPRWMMF
jgi:hypothetical protein